MAGIFRIQLYEALHTGWLLWRLVAVAQGYGPLFARLPEFRQQYSQLLKVDKGFVRRGTAPALAKLALEPVQQEVQQLMQQARPDYEFEAEAWRLLPDCCHSVPAV